MPRRYAEGTLVAVENSQLEIGKMVAKFGAERYSYIWSTENEKDFENVSFVINGRGYRMSIPSPSKSEFKVTETGRRRTSQNTINEAWDQRRRELWRALVLVVKAKLAAVQLGITTIEDEFMSSTVMPNGETYSGFGKEQIRVIYEYNEKGLPPGEVPNLLEKK